MVMRKKKARKLYCIDLSDNSYDQTVMVFYKNPEPVVTFLKDTYGVVIKEGYIKENLGVTCMDTISKGERKGRAIFFTYVPEIRMTAKSIQSITHELVHVISYLFSHVGVPFSNKMDETFAYQIDFFIGKIFNYIKEKNRKEKK
jgi:hypothetical protein